VIRHSLEACRQQPQVDIAKPVYQSHVYLVAITAAGNHPHACRHSVPQFPGQVLEAARLMKQIHNTHCTHCRRNCSSAVGCLCNRPHLHCQGRCATAAAGTALVQQRGGLPLQHPPQARTVGCGTGPGRPRCPWRGRLPGWTHPAGAVPTKAAGCRVCCVVMVCVPYGSRINIPLRHVTGGCHTRAARACKYTTVTWYGTLRGVTSHLGCDVTGRQVEAGQGAPAAAQGSNACSADSKTVQSFRRYACQMAVERLGPVNTTFCNCRLLCCCCVLLSANRVCMTDAQ
jgi:hypothetical protein